MSLLFTQIKKRALKINKEEMFLYTVLDINTEPTFACWNLKILFSNLLAGQRGGLPSPPLTLTPLEVLPKPNNILNFQPILIKSFYNKNQFSFFFPDESVTDSAIYTSSNHPSYLLGTNYGRIFMISMFQETEDRVLPILVIDSHHKSKITKLFVAYNSSRKQPNKLKQPVLMENGGHLISVSEDGTIAVTNLNSGEIVQTLHSQQSSHHKNPDNARADMFFEQRERKRRNSFSCDFSVANFFEFVKVKSQRIFHYAAYGQIDRVIEVKNLNVIADQINTRDKNMSQ
jgi:hypothetical protein